MSLPLDEFRCKLIDKILFANSQEEVGRFIDAAVKSLQVNKINGHIISRFLDKITGDLDLFNPMNKEAQQWSNIKMARIHFNLVRRQLNLAVK